jgi:radical SAM protein with 4Fe4S-binding SPASM domain
MSKFLAAPNNAIWDITYRCNLRCKHCYVSGGRETKELSTEEAKEIIEQLAQNKVFTVSFTGGEPLLREDIFDLIEYAREFKLSAVLASNGWYIDEKCARRLKETGLDYVMLSLDGQDAETHDFIRGQGSFRKVIEATANLQKVRIPFGLTLVLNRLNLGQIENVAYLAESLKANQLRLYRLLNEGRAEEKSLQGLSAQETTEIMERVRNLAVGVPVVFDEAFGFLAGLPKRRGFFGVGCSAARTVVGIKASGDVTPCPMLVDPKFYAGNLLNQSFKEIWQNSPVMNFFRNLPKLKGKCGECPHLEVCGGGCRVVAYSLTGDISASDPGCSLAIGEKH